MLNICSSVQDHNQSQRAKEFYLKLKASEEMRLKNAYEELRLKQRV